MESGVESFLYLRLAIQVVKSSLSDCLSVTRVRLSEGFHFASSGDGIINMVLELPIQVSLEAAVGMQSFVNSPSCGGCVGFTFPPTPSMYPWCV